ncbi:uncharacterized protein LOC113363925 isoform X2 [Ctenocephalides felis]|uniref:uncharacterized protein LOC113363925 isoform X2 n=1 Tax=Ctenocephalides felis TaxID=7515 RepID=UPI000E6E35EE|nr:uncharacterized protein LOC113363925 isoform X2 [Ctenocephalides felis]
MNKILLWFILALSGVLVNAYAVTYNETAHPDTLPVKSFKEIYDGLESDERSYFLLFELARGFSIMESKFPLGFYPITRARCHTGLRVPDDLDIPKELSDKFLAFGVSESESESLYRWVANSFKIHVERRVKLRQNVVCFPNGACIDLDDVGSHCCPF